jgi:hypothetical protein
MKITLKIWNILWGLNHTAKYQLENDPRTIALRKSGLSMDVAYLNKKKQYAEVDEWLKNIKQQKGWK